MKVKINELLYILFTASIVTLKFAGIMSNQYLKYILIILWIFMSFLLWKPKMEYVKAVKIHCAKGIAPILAMVLFTSSIWILGIVEVPSFRYITRLASTSIYLILAIVYAGTAVLFLGAKAIDLTWYSMIISYLIGSVLCAFISTPIDSLRYLITFSDDIGVANFFEVHDLTFSLGFYLIYFLFLGKNRNISHRYAKIMITALFILWGYKRIEFLAIFVAMGIYILLGRKFKDLKPKALIISAGVIGVSLLYVWLASSGILEQISIQYGIDFKGRLYTYDYMTRYFQFDIRFWGRGFSYVDKLIEELRNIGVIYRGWMLLTGLHSDILKKYIELGFIGFIVWEDYCLRRRTLFFKDKFSIGVASIYLIFTVYSFVIYFTDNIFEYCNVTIVYTLIPLALSCSNPYGVGKSMPNAEGD